MSSVNSIGKSISRKPKKPKPPFKDFPLWPHPSGRWAKKVKGRVYYFGKWDDPHGALDQWHSDQADILAGRKRKSRLGKSGNDDAPTVRDLVNRFLTSKKNLVDAGELTNHSFVDYNRVCGSLVDAFGAYTPLTEIGPSDFERLRVNWAKRCGPVRLGNEINRAKVVFNYGFKNGLIDRPMQYGTGFDRPSARVLELHRSKKGKRMFEADELRGIIAKAPQPLKAMFLMGINCGFSNADVARIPIDAVDLKTGWVNYAREKTGIARRCWLWPETTKAINDWLDTRPTPKPDAEKDLLFLTSIGGSWYRPTADNPVARATRAMLDKMEIKGSNKNFLALRHGFEMIAGASRDQAAVDAVMGHRDASMAARYREGINDARLRAVAEHVRTWLFSAPAPEVKGGAA